MQGGPSSVVDLSTDDGAGAVEAAFGAREPLHCLDARIRRLRGGEHAPVPLLE